jgi:hypothetical protein
MFIRMMSRPQGSPKSGHVGSAENRIGSLGMSNVLSDEKKQQVIALGKLGWSLRRIEEVTGVQGNSERLSKNSRSGGVPAWVGTPSAGKTGHTGDPRLWAKTGHSDPRLY